MPTIDEREKLLPVINPHESGFSPRYAARQASERRPRSIVDIDCRHVLRCDVNDSTNGRPSVTYRLWLEAGKLQPPSQPGRPDVTVNSSVWRNFRRQYSDYLSVGDSANRSGSTPRRVDDATACTFPVTVPSASNVGDYTYSRFLTESPLIKDTKRRQAVIRQVEKDVEQFRQLRLRSELRDPPMTASGNIAPPQYYHHYPPHAPPTADESVTVAPPPTVGDGQVDVFGRYIARPARSKDSHLWKLEYRLNNPEYKRIQQELETIHRQKKAATTLATLSKQTLTLPPALC
jgi:hypothetical protein